MIVKESKSPCLLVNSSTRLLTNKRTTIMKKILLTIASSALAIAVNAQVSVTQQNISVIENNPNMTQRQHSQVVAKAPKKIASNQRWVGYYSSDALADPDDGMGVPSYPGENKVGIYLTESILEPYIGMKIVGIRFGLCEDIGQSGVYLHRIVDGIPGQVVTSNYVQYGKTGWNQEDFPKPYVIKEGEELAAVFEYTQYGDQEDHSFPLSFVKEGDGSIPIWYWCLYNGTNYSWNQFDAGGKNLSIQVLVEGDFPVGSSVESVTASGNAVEVARYNAAGQLINGKQKGLNIVKLSDGTTRKVMVR